MNILILYNATQTYTNNVYDHVASFAKYSINRVFYCHVDPLIDMNMDFRKFDALVIHYSLRIIFGQLNNCLQEKIKYYKGIKCLFIQDEHEFHNRASAAIKYMGMDFVFTCVPKGKINNVYPKNFFEGTKFINCLTGYVSDLQLQQKNNFAPPSRREIIVGYRGRPLSIRYGQMGQDKIKIGQLFKKSCDQEKIKNDISWEEGDRIYGDEWYRFIGNCRGMLGTESGANVFDWDGKLLEQIEEWKKLNPKSSDEILYNELIKKNECQGLMNQISPRVFETIVARTVLVLFEGGYSDIIKPGIHYISVRKDGSNIHEVLELLKDSNYVDSMTERAYKDIISSGKYTYSNFIAEFDGALSLGKMCDVLDEKVSDEFKYDDCIFSITLNPIRAVVDKHALQIDTGFSLFSPNSNNPKNLINKILFVIQKNIKFRNLAMNFSMFFWMRLSLNTREFLRPKIKRLLKKGD